jgi:hypothetical protein
MRSKTSRMKLSDMLLSREQLAWTSSIFSFFYFPPRWVLRLSNFKLRSWYESLSWGRNSGKLGAFDISAVIRICNHSNQGDTTDGLAVVVPCELTSRWGPSARAVMIERRFLYRYSLLSLEHLPENTGPTVSSGPSETWYGTKYI